MIGYDIEEKAYCCELTYNYGETEYPPGTGLVEFGIFVPDVAAAAKVARELGYGVMEEEGEVSVDGGKGFGTQTVVCGPDAYRWRLLALPSGRTERFSYVMCRVSDLQKSLDFYKGILGFSEATAPPAPVPEKSATIGYPTESHPHKLEQVALVLFQDGVKVENTPWSGRHAFAINADEVKELHAKLKEKFPTYIMHDSDGAPISLDEKLGTLFIFIAKDPDGYEHCFVSRETMLPLTKEAVENYDPKALDWCTRMDKLEEEGAKRKREAQQSGGCCIT